MPLSAGTRLGSYEIVAPLGAVFVTPDGKAYAYGAGRILTSDLYLASGLK